jgi:hypothetical protein
MMATRKLTDSELAARTRAGNRRRAERQRERLTNAGRVATTVWLTATTKAALANAAAANNETISDTAERLVSAALKTTTTRDTPATPATTPTAAASTLDLFEKPASATTATTTTDKDALMKEVGALVDEGFSGNEIARRFNSEGRRTVSGAEFSSGNLLRDYRAWLKKTGSADSGPDAGAQ